MVKSQTLDLGSGHDLTVHGIKSHVGLCADIAETAWDSLPLSAPSLLALSLFQNKHLRKLYSQPLVCIYYVIFREFASLVIFYLQLRGKFYVCIFLHFSLL